MNVIANIFHNSVRHNSIITTFKYIPNKQCLVDLLKGRISKCTHKENVQNQTYQHPNHCMEIDQKYTVVVRINIQTFHVARFDISGHTSFPSNSHTTPDAKPPFPPTPTQHQMPNLPSLQLPHNTRCHTSLPSNSHTTPDAKPPFPPTSTQHQMPHLHSLQLPHNTKCQTFLPSNSHTTPDATPPFPPTPTQHQMPNRKICSPPLILLFLHQ